MNKQIKIVHLGYMHKYSDTRIFEKECKSLLKLDNVDITFVTSDRSGSFLGEYLDGIKIIILPLIKKRYIKFINYIRELRKLCLDMDGDIYHIHELALVPLIPYLKKHGKKVIYDKHEDTFDNAECMALKYFSKSISRFFAKRFVKYETKCIEKCDGYIYVTPQHEIPELKIPEYLIPNFPKMSNFEAISRTTRDTSVDGAVKLCYCGGISDTWSLVDIASIVKKSDGVTFDFAGRGSDAYINSMLENDMNSSIKYYGDISFSEVKEIYEKSDIGVATLKRCLGDVLNADGTLANTKIFEYMQFGIPVIFTDFPIWKKINDEYNFGIPVSGENLHTVENAIQFISDNPDEAAKMGKNGQRAIAEKYNWENSERYLIELYSKLIKETL